MIITSGNKMSENVKKFGNTTSMHGVPWLINARSNKAKVFWGLVCVIGMFMFIYMLVSLVIKYFTFPVIIKVDQVRNLSSYFWFVPHVNFVKLILLLYTILCMICIVCYIYTSVVQGSGTLII